MIPRATLDLLATLVGDAPAEYRVDAHFGPLGGVLFWRFPIGPASELIVLGGTVRWN